jgi:hypothetical protein
MRGDEDLQAQLQNALAECSRLREENARLQRLIPDPVSRSNQSPESTEGKHLDRNTATTSDLVRNSSPPETVEHEEDLQNLKEDLDLMVQRGSR